MASLSLPQDCPYCGKTAIDAALHCSRCGGTLEALTPRSHMWEQLRLARTLIRHRAWSRLADALKSVQSLFNADPNAAKGLDSELGWLAQDFAQHFEPLVGAELVKLATQAKHVLSVLPSELAASLQKRCDGLTSFLDTLAAAEKQMKEKGPPPPEKIKAWLQVRIEKLNLPYAEAHACIYANPGRWPTLAAALDAEAYKPARLLINCSVADKELREKNYGRAKKLFTGVLAKDAGCIRAWEGLSLVEAALKNWPEPIRCLREACKLGTRESRTFNNLAWYLATEGTPTKTDLDEALTCARRAVELAPCDGFYDTMAEVQRRRGAWTEALAAARAAYRLNPDRRDFKDRLLRIAEEFQKTQPAASTDRDVVALDDSSDSEFELSLDAEADHAEAGDSEFELALDEEADASQALADDDSVFHDEDAMDLAASAAMPHSDAAPRLPAVFAELITPQPRWTPPAETAPPATDQLQFTITSQKELTPGEPTLIDVWAHLAGQRDVMLQRAQDAQRGEAIASRSSTNVAVVRGSTISVQLKLAGFEVPDPDAAIVWDGDIGNASFPVLVPESIRRGKHLGMVLFFIEGKQVAKLHFDVVVASAAAKPKRSAFASYQSNDRAKVTARVQGLQKALPELDVFLDVLALRSGQNWEQRLREEIARRDVFYLFWSTNASKSKEVDKEWRLALELRGPDYIDPVPLESPKFVPPPPELAHKHFNDWTLMYSQ